MNPCTPEWVERAAGLLETASRVLFHLGPAAQPATDTLVELATLLGAPVLTTPDAKSILDECHPHAGGVFSFGADAFARDLVERADVVLAIGTNLGEFATRGGKALAGCSIIHITADSSDLTGSVVPTTTFVGDIVQAVRSIAARLASWPRRSRWFATHAAVARPPEARSAAPGTIHPAEATRAIADALPARARIACDVTSAALHLLQGLKLNPDRRLWMQLERSACMGSALSAGLGVRLAAGLPTLVVVGDWGLWMGISELPVVASQALEHFVVLVWSNSGGALIRSGVRAQRIDVPDETHSWPSPHVALVARGCRMRALTVRSASGLRRALPVALRAPFPVLIDAAIDPAGEIPGAGDRYEHLEGPRWSA